MLATESNSFAPNPAPFCFLSFGLPGMSRAHEHLRGPRPLKPFQLALFMSFLPFVYLSVPTSPPELHHLLKFVIYSSSFTSNSGSLWKVQVTHHQLVLGSGDGGQDVDAVGREVASVFGPVIDSMSPAGVHHLFSIMFI